MQVYSKETVGHQWSRRSPDPKSTGTMILDLPALRLVQFSLVQ